VAAADLEAGDGVVMGWEAAQNPPKVHRVGIHLHRKAVAQLKWRVKGGQGTGAWWGVSNVALQWAVTH